MSILDKNKDNKFKNSMGKFYTRALFFEEVEGDKASVVYTLKRDDHLGYPSLYRLYMAIADPTEYRFAVSCLDCWAHWTLLRELDWFKPYITEWRGELEAKLRSEQIGAILEISRDKSNQASFTANKYLLEALGKPAGELKRGRPSRDEVKAEITRQAASKAEIASDAKRIGLNIFN